MITSTYEKAKKQYKVSFILAQDRVGENRDVRVLGNFNDWSWDNGLKLTSGKDGYTGETQLPTGTYQFRYLVDGHHWVNDDSANSYTDSGHGTTNCCFALEEVQADEQKSTAKKPATKKAPAKAKTTKSGKSDSDSVTIEAASSAPASQPVVDPDAEKRKSDAQTSDRQGTDAAPDSDKKKPAAKKPAAKKPVAKKPAAKRSPKAPKSDDKK